MEEVRRGGGGGDDGVVARWREREDKKYQVISGKCFCRRTGSAEGKKGRWSDTKDGRARRKKSVEMILYVNKEIIMMVDIAASMPSAIAAMKISLRFR